ncbi:GNAT family N-acetyltransferase [Arthrobacter sp. efr-133-TYG-104]|uniref:GNAT family N-acetyltransferase n=1 Tax=Arthrobacter sp. efr-133-TYG-104 TaxID=3040324 RepID=UPI002551C4BD|nr:GNAT family N-acetyltransferase [Arthrobacter sp. efr-133-TYG-104]
MLTLIDVDGSVMNQLLAFAKADADANEVTPLMGEAPGWNAERIAWFTAYHSAATRIDGPAREKTWAVIVDGTIAGSVRLKRTGPNAVESGIWLGRSFRNRGLGGQAPQQVVAKAAGYGATVLEASTSMSNTGAQSLLLSLGAEFHRNGTQVTARLMLG